MAHYLITGHTGFKGSWLTLLLKSRGHEVSGLALEPLSGSLFERANISSDLTHDFRVDVRNRDGVVDSFQEAKPDVVIHMAAQALVREGYRDPIGTYETNVNGTLHVLQASDATDSVMSQLIVTTDKVYRDDGLRRPYVESDPLGGKDPYSASKAMADLLAQEYFHNERTKPGAIARAGNVIGAGDESKDRLIPDLLRSIKSGGVLEVRYPNAVRPWQHVLECLDGYLKILDHLALEERKGAPWNIGPDKSLTVSVTELLELASETVAPAEVDLRVVATELFEADALILDSNQASVSLGWIAKLSLHHTVQMAVAEARSSFQKPLRDIVVDQIEEFDRIMP